MPGHRLAGAFGVMALDRLEYLPAHLDGAFGNAGPVHRLAADLVQKVCHRIVERLQQAVSGGLHQEATELEAQYHGAGKADSATDPSKSTHMSRNSATSSSLARFAARPTTWLSIAARTSCTA